MFFIDMCMPQNREKKKKEGCVCGKHERSKNREKEWHTKVAEIKFCTYQYLSISQSLGLGLGRKLCLRLLK